MSDDNEKVFKDFFKKAKDINLSDTAKGLKDGLVDKANKVKDKIDEVDWKEVKDTTKDSIKNATHTAGDALNKVADLSKEKAMSALDANGDGVIDSTDLVIISLKVPGIKIKREEFLKKELSGKYIDDVIDKAISEKPLNAGITTEEINKIADQVIDAENKHVSDIVSTLGMVGGPILSLTTIPANLAQYYGYMLRCAQKLLYLYGFPQIDINNPEQSTETLDMLSLCLAVMYGDEDARMSMTAVAQSLGDNVQGQIAKDGYGKTIKKFTGRIKKKGFIKNSLKNLASGAGTLIGDILADSFKPACIKLKESLNNTVLSNPDFKLSKEEQEFIDTIENEKEVPAEENKDC